jgi:hypothetical protein
MDHNSQKPSLTLPLVIVLAVLFLFDMAIIGGILIHGKANFSALIKNLHHG